jgi:hypothetical protein
MNRPICVSVVVIVFLGALIPAHVQWAQESVGEALLLDGVVVDDFEQYSDDDGNRMAQTWADGLYNGSGSIVGNAEPPLAERKIVHGGKQSMPLRYDNAKSPFYSEIEREYAPVQDWTVGGADTLSLWVRGDVVSFAEPSPGSFILSGIGEDVWSNFDRFRYACRRLSGDGSIIARVTGVTNTDDWAKYGVMIREGLAPGSAYAFMFITPSGTRAFENRAANGSGFTKSAHGYHRGIKPPFWVKVERKGNQLTGYYSADGREWIKQREDEGDKGYLSPNPQTINMPGSVYIGLAACSHDTNIVGTATFSHVVTTGAVRGEWQIADIGVDQPGNVPDDMYVIVKDSTGKTAMVTSSDPGLVNAMAWTEWKIPLSSLAGVNLQKVKKVYIGVGSRKVPTPTGAGRIYIDDISVVKSGS